MTSTRSPRGQAGVSAAAGTRGPGARTRGPRLALLCAAAAVVLLGAAVAGVVGYLMISHGQAAVTGAAARR